MYIVKCLQRRGGPTMWWVKRHFHFKHFHAQQKQQEKEKQKKNQHPNILNAKREENSNNYGWRHVQFDFAKQTANVCVFRALRENAKVAKCYLCDFLFIKCFLLHAIMIACIYYSGSSLAGMSDTHSGVADQRFQMAFRYVHVALDWISQVFKSK